MVKYNRCKKLSGLRDENLPVLKSNEQGLWSDILSGIKAETNS